MSLKWNGMGGMAATVEKEKWCFLSSLLWPQPSKDRWSHYTGGWSQVTNPTKKWLWGKVCWQRDGTSRGRGGWGKEEEESSRHVDWEAFQLSYFCCSEGKDIPSLSEWRIEGEKEHCLSTPHVWIAAEPWGTKKHPLEISERASPSGRIRTGGGGIWGSQVHTHPSKPGPYHLEQVAGPDHLTGLLM